MPASQNGWPLEDKFWSSLEITPSGCWESILAKGKNKYGTRSFRGKPSGSHRIAFTLIYGEIPNGSIICHTCDNPACANPYHLYEGSYRDNMIDAVERQRHNSISRPDARPHKNKTHCVNGHVYNNETTYKRPGSGRGCRICRRVAMLKHRNKVSV